MVQNKQSKPISYLGGGLIQLVAYGAQDVFLTNRAQQIKEMKMVNKCLFNNTDMPKVMISMIMTYIYDDP